MDERRRFHYSLLFYHYWVGIVVATRVGAVLWFCLWGLRWGFHIISPLFKWFTILLANIPTRYVGTLPAVSSKNTTPSETSGSRFFPLVHPSDPAYVRSPIARGLWKPPAAGCIREGLHTLRVSVTTAQGICGFVWVVLPDLQLLFILIDICLYL